MLAPPLHTLPPRASRTLDPPWHRPCIPVVPNRLGPIVATSRPKQHLPSPDLLPRVATQPRPQAHPSDPIGPIYRGQTHPISLHSSILCAQGFQHPRLAVRRYTRSQALPGTTPCPQAPNDSLPRVQATQHPMPGLPATRTAKPPHRLTPM